MRLLERGYSRNLLKKDYNTTLAMNRESLLYQKRDQPSTEVIRCILILTVNIKQLSGFSTNIGICLPRNPFSTNFYHSVLASLTGDLKP